MHTRRETLLCRYHYDPLDRLVDCRPSEQAITQRFYLKDRLATEIQGAVQRSIMQHDDQLLAQQQRQKGSAKTTLLATDHQRSVLKELDATSSRSFAYTPYGHRLPKGGLLGFNGERPDPVMGWYLLGNGYRPFNPVLMCFTSPDSWSPFGEGGLNAYAYCARDPVNRNDPTGHAFFLDILRKMKFWSSPPSVKKNVSPAATKDFLVGTYKKTVPTKSNQMSPPHPRLDQRLPSNNIERTSPAPKQADVLFESATRALITREQRAVKQLIGSLGESPSKNHSELLRIEINVRDKRTLKYQHELSSKPAPAQSRNDIREE